MSVIAKLSPDILTPWSDRDLTYEFGPDEAGLQVYRDGNKDLQLADPVGGLASAKKYALTITGDDINAFALGGVWPGDAFTVELAQTTWHQLPSGTNSVTVERNIVSGSVSAYRKDGEPLTVSSVVGRVITVASHTGQVAFVGYRMSLAMLLSDPWKSRFQRNAMVTSHSLVFREV